MADFKEYDLLDEVNCADSCEAIIALCELVDELGFAFSRLAGLQDALDNNSGIGEGQRHAQREIMRSPQNGLPPGKVPGHTEKLHGLQSGIHPRWPRARDAERTRPHLAQTTCFEVGAQFVGKLIASPRYGG